MTKKQKLASVEEIVANAQFQKIYKRLLKDAQRTFTPLVDASRNEARSQARQRAPLKRRWSR